MAVYYKDGTWKQVPKKYTKVNNSWKLINCVYVKLNGTWEAVHCGDGGSGGSGSSTKSVSPEIFWSLTQTKNANDVLDDGARPLNLQANPDGAEVKVHLSWEVFSKDIVDYYNVYRSTSSGSGFTKINGTSTTSEQYTDDSVSDSTKYYYHVTAQTTNGIETDSTQTESVEVFTITTLSATNINPEYATLNGEVGDPPETSTINTFFEWGEEQGQGLPNSTPTENLMAPTGFQRTLLTFDGSEVSYSPLTKISSGGVSGVSIGEGYIAYGGGDDYEVYVHDLSNGSLEYTFSEASGDVRDVAIGKDYIVYSSYYGENVHVHDLSDGSLEYTLSGGSDYVYTVAIGEGYVAYGGQSNETYVHDLSDGSLEYKFTQASDNVNGTSIAEGYIAYSGKDDNAYVHDLSNGNLVYTLSQASDNVWDVEIAEEYVAYGGGDNDTYVHDLNDGSLVYTLTESAGSIKGVDINGDYIAYGGDDDNVYVHDLSDGGNLEDVLPQASSNVYSVSLGEGYAVYGEGDGNTYVHYSTQGKLDPSTKYEYRAVAQLNGKMLKGNIETFTTTS